MTSKNEQLIETFDEEGNKVSFQLLDIVTVDDVEYALLLPENNTSNNGENEVLVMRLKKDGEEFLFEVIEDDNEFNKIAQYIEELENEVEE